VTGLFTHCCIDTSALIDLYDSTMKHKQDEALWVLFGDHVSLGAVVSHREVRKEILRGSDGLATWAKPRGSFFVDPTAEQVRELQGLLVLHGRNAVHLDRHHAHDADPWLVALGKSDGLVVVTSESRKRAFGIPSLCASVGVRWAGLAELTQVLRGQQEGWSAVPPGD